MELTARQSEILAFIRAFRMKNDTSPSVRDIAAHFDVNVSGIQGHIDALKRRGALLGERSDIDNGKLNARSLSIAGETYAEIVAERDMLKAKVAQLEIAAAPKEVEKPKRRSSTKK